MARRAARRSPLSRLKNPGGRPDFFDDLMDRIREIRASEKRMWTRVLELASFCSDYNLMRQQSAGDGIAAA
ncbi:MAG: RhuM family protein [Rhodomicrobium sp.]